MTVPAISDTRTAATPSDAARDRPDAYIPRDRRWALHTGTDLPDRVRGAALFADISGFTPLTEALANELGPQRGAEELTANLDRVFHEVIAALVAYDGNVIYFAGDAITCWIDGDDGSRACAAAIGMQAAIERSGRIVTPGGAEVGLAMKVAIAVGPARRFVVGDPDIQLIDVLAGRLMDDLAGAEHHAQRGEIVLDESAMAALEGRVSLGAPRIDEASGRVCAPLQALTIDVAGKPGVEPDALPEDQVRSWLLPAVYERLRAGRGEFLAELRPAVPVFVRFGGIDYDNDDDASDKLDDFVRAAQRAMNGYGGNVLQLTLGDKGAYLYGVLGSPLAHEDDAGRAAAAALDLRDLARTTAARDIQVGIAQGPLRSGTYGHEMRRTFVCLGDSVNLAARLMAAAPPERIYVAGAVREAAGEAFIWERLPDLTVKGKAQPVEVWSLNGSLERASRRKTRFALELIGRRDELAMLEDSLQRATDGEGTIVGIAAEAGMGKSRLVAEFTRNARRRGHTVAFGECQAYGTKTPYFVWREIWRRILDLADDDSRERQIELVEDRLSAIDPDLVARAPLLSEVIGVSIPDTDLTRAFDAKLRKASLEDLLVTCLRSRAQASPFVMVLEDCHWIDELSRDLLQVLTRSAAGLPVLFVLAYRPAAEPGGDLAVEQHPGFAELVLDNMGAEEIAQLVRSKLGELTGGLGEVADAVVDLVAARSEGNPFYVEELLNYLVANGVDTADPGAVEGLRLPESLHTLILSRIDAAAEGPRRTMKVASVVGRVFSAPMLPGAYVELGDLDTVIGDLDALRVLDLVALDREADQAWMFKHVVTQEVAYESLPFALRAILHGLVGDYIERAQAADLDRQVPLLEHHFWRSDREDKKVEYLHKAAAAAQASYANQAAITYYERLIPLITGSECVEATIRLAQVFHVIGDIPHAEAMVKQARAIAVAIGAQTAVARCDHLLGESARRLGRFDDAQVLLEIAYQEFTALDDRAGLGEVVQTMGTVCAQRGEPAGARECYEQSLSIREGLGDTAGMAGVINNLGIVAMQLGDLDQARAFGQRALELYSGLGDPRRLSSCHINLAWMDGSAGDNDSALQHGEEAARLARQAGDRLNLAIARNNMGDSFRDLGRHREAADAYGEAAAAYYDLGDSGPLMALLEDVAVLAARAGRARDAFLLAGAADALRATMGAARSASADETLAAQLSDVAETLGAPAAEAVREQGRGLSVDRAVAMVLAMPAGTASA
jgi:class 3 adenylate cyclase/tetratricopeptide (TPR) repeat protein